jgi:hypothetical protein
MSINSDLFNKREKIVGCLRNAKLVLNIALFDYETHDKNYDIKLQRHRYATGELAKASDTGMKYALEIATAAEAAYQIAVADWKKAKEGVLHASTAIIEWENALQQVDREIERSGISQVSNTPANTPRLKTIA